jgi:hypothetical protein
MVQALTCEADAVVNDMTINKMTINELKAFFQTQNKKVVTFTGYSGSGYEDAAAMLRQAGILMNEFDPETTLINIGATVDGIGAVYEIAKQRGFTTTGIVSIQAKKYNAQISSWVDHVFYIEDATWGGLLPDSGKLAPTSEALVSVSDFIIGIGGGRPRSRRTTRTRRSWTTRSRRARSGPSRRGSRRS